ncbi:MULTISPECIES: hypothetical protein [unclassified Streptomyces]|uniref:hypothetical protein n=1 Tax=unclassified Streptomyces TaxID=2593676 RepID=UPI00081DD08B|nr:MULTISPECIES: hypothetical protein [unclassified Streptomyces]UCA50516.1 hypothetical protein LEL86_15000 [Streptomyces sp. WA6-1-16]SCF58711.1 hypothetical protein GA0115280_102683 [Streptomyces sp. Cmuel-A718b]
MRRFIAYIVLTHHLGQAPSEDSVGSFIEEYGNRLEEGQEWQIDEDEVWHVALAEYVNRGSHRRPHGLRQHAHTECT